MTDPIESGDNIAQVNAGIILEVERAMRERNDLSFWGMGKAIRTPVIKESNPRYGSWFSDTFVGDSGDHFGLACSIQPGEIKTGVTLMRNRARDIAPEEIRSMCPDYRDPDIVRPMRTLTLYDWIYREGPFRAKWFHRAYGGDKDALAMIASMASSIVVNTWKGAATWIATKYRLFHREYAIVAEREIDVAALLRDIEGAVDYNTHDARIGQIVVLYTNENAERVRAAVARICPSASVSESESAAQVMDSRDEDAA